jgi:hypothetical protein
MRALLLLTLTACTAQRVERETDSVRAACRMSQDSSAVCQALTQHKEP